MAEQTLTTLTRRLIEKVDLLLSRIDERGLVDQINNLDQRIQAMMVLCEECRCKQEFNDINGKIDSLGQLIKTLPSGSGGSASLFPKGLEKPYPGAVMPIRHNTDPSYWYDNPGLKKLIEEQNRSIIPKKE